MSGFRSKDLDVVGLLRFRVQASTGLGFVGPVALGGVQGSMDSGCIKSYTRNPKPEIEFRGIEPSALVIGG